MAVSNGRKVSNFWRGNLNISIREALVYIEPHIKGDCPINMDKTSGYMVSVFDKANSQKKFQGFVTEAGARNALQLLPVASMRIADAMSKPFVLPKIDTEISENAMFTTPLMFGASQGMTIADMLANHYSTYELQKIQSVLSANMDKYALNKVLYAGIEKAIAFLDENNGKEVNRIIASYSNPPLSLYNGIWHTLVTYESGVSICSKVDIWANSRAAFPFLMRLTTRTCRKAAEGNTVEYPYRNQQIQTTFITMDIDDISGQLLYPMELSSQLFRKKVYDEVYNANIQRAN